MSATVGFNPPPTPGEVGLVHVRSCVPSPLVSGEPIFKPCPGIVMQFVPSVRPISAQVWLMIPEALTPAPGKLRNCEAIEPDGDSPSNAEVSYQPVEVTLKLLRYVS